MWLLTWLLTGDLPLAVAPPALQSVCALALLPAHVGVHAVPHALGKLAKCEVCMEVCVHILVAAPPAL